MLDWKLRTCNCASCYLDGFVCLCHHVLHPLLHRSVIKATWKHEQQQSHWLQSCMAVYSSNLALHHLSGAAWLHVCSQRMDNSINMWYLLPSYTFSPGNTRCWGQQCQPSAQSTHSTAKSDFQMFKGQQRKGGGEIHCTLHVQHFPLNWNTF